MRVPFKAWYFRSTVDEEQVRKKFQEFTIEFIDPLVVKIDDFHRVMVTSFGAVVFYSFDEGIAKLVSSRISETLSDSFVVKEVEDRLIVETDKPDERFLYNEIWLKGDESLPTQMRIIAMLLAQSVALDHLEREADNAMSGFTRYLEDLREEGTIRMSARHILKNIGFAMQTRFMVLNNVALFDKPAETWESEAIEDLFQGMRDFFDIAERQDVLAAKLDFISENTRMLFEVLSSRKSHYLEWIVIVLIAVEIVGLGLVELIRAIAAK
jgi:required for meiotic nuclear division protein 1